MHIRQPHLVTSPARKPVENTKEKNVLLLSIKFIKVFTWIYDDHAPTHVYIRKTIFVISQFSNEKLFFCLFSTWIKIVFNEAAVQSVEKTFFALIKWTYQRGYAISVSSRCSGNRFEAKILWIVERLFKRLFNPPSERLNRNI